jgi:hypothetical protein
MRVLAAVVKVGVLLSLKMLLLPLLLGGCLDAAALPLFVASPADRLRFLSANLVSTCAAYCVCTVYSMAMLDPIVIEQSNGCCWSLHCSVVLLRAVLKARLLTPVLHMLHTNVTANTLALFI